MFGTRPAPVGTAIVLALVGAPPAPARVDPGVARAVRVDVPPVVDGRLDDDAWTHAPPFDDMLVRVPEPGAQPADRTVVRLVYDDDALYVGVRAMDADPGSIVARARRRDNTGGDDRIRVVLDSNGDARTGFWFTVTAAGARSDGLVDNNEYLGDSWDGIWTAKARVDDAGYAVEIRVPFKTVTLNPSGGDWGLNVERYVASRNETISWRNVRRDASAAELSQAGVLTGITGARQGAGVDVKPFLVAEYDAKADNLTLEPGVDIFYRLTPQITAALTVNTDFAETEVDDRVVNLTRFPLFFPEKRDFFLEDEGQFDFGGVRQSPRPFFSRRIGIVDGEEREILAGLKLTGRSGDVRLGMLSVQMKQDDELGDKNLSVVRLTHDVGEESAVGMILTNGDPAERGNNTLLGVDLSLADSAAFAGTGSISANIWAQGTYSDPSERVAENSDTTAVGGRVGINRDPWDFNLFFARIGEHYDPGLGFVSRQGRYEFSTSAGHRWWMPEASPIVRDVRVTARFSSNSFLDGRFEDYTATPLDLTVTSRRGDRISLSPQLYFDRLVEPFEIVDDVVIPIGTYDSAGASLEFATTSSRPISIQTDVGYRSFFDGARLDLRGQIGLRPSPSFSGSLEHTYTSVDLDQGDFIVRVLRARASVAFTPDITWDNTIQWDNQSDQAGVNSRVRWEFTPGQELFLVYNEGFDVEDDGSFTSREQLVTIKAGLTIRF